MDFMTFEDNREFGDEGSPRSTVDEDRAQGFAILAATGEQIGVREAAKKMPRGTYLCSRCVQIALIEEGAVDPKACAVFPRCGRPSRKALHFAHHNGSTACRQRGESVFHEFWKNLLARELGGLVEVCYPGTSRRADVYVPSTNEYHEVVVESDMSEDKSHALKAAYESGTVIWKYRTKHIPDPEKIRWLDRYHWDPESGSAASQGLLRLLLNTREIYVRKEVRRSSDNGDRFKDRIAKTIPIDQIERCGPRCLHYGSMSDGPQLRITDGFCNYGAVGSGAKVTFGDPCAIRAKKGAFRAAAK
jgi:hypothetical protein